MVGRRTLNPSIQVRILAWEPSRIHLHRTLCKILPLDVEWGIKGGLEDVFLFECPSRGATPLDSDFRRNDVVAHDTP